MFYVKLNILGTIFFGIYLKLPPDGWEGIAVNVSSKILNSCGHTGFNSRERNDW